MANPNPYKLVELPNWFLDALEKGDHKTVIRYAQFCLHTKRKFEQCYAREYNRNRKLREQLERCANP